MNALVNLKDNIWIECFELYDSFFKRNSALISLNYITFGKYDILYSGKTSEIHEELVKECVNKYSGLNPELYWNYSIPYPHHYIDCEFKIAKKSIQSACNQEFCIIYKAN